MRKILIPALLALSLSTVVRAQELESDLELLGALHQVRSMWIDPAVADWEVRRWIDGQIDAWRGPLRDGGYEWVLQVRPESEVVDRSEQLIYGTRDRLARIEDGDTWVYGVRLVVPRKRSLFRGNHPVWVDSITIRLESEDGETTEDSVSVGRWFEPNSSQTWDFEMIVPRSDVVVEAAAEDGHRGESLLEVHFLEAVERDDPEGPFYGAIRSLSELEGWMTAERIDETIARVEGNLIPRARPVPVTMTVELLDRALAAIDSDDPEEQEKARAAIVEALRLLRQNHR